MSYTCAVCAQKIQGDLIAFSDHTDQHVIDLIKHDHPEWVQADGLCQPCIDYYRSEINGSFFKTAPCAKRR